MRRYTPEGIEEAKRYFQEALQKDPNFGLVYVRQAWISIFETYWGNVTPHEAYSKAKEYIQKALEINDALAEAHAVLGHIHAFYDWDWKEAEDELKQALQLDPKNAENHLWYSYYLTVTERHEAAIIEAKQAQDLDPLNSEINANRGLALLHARQYDTAVEELRTALKIDPDYHQSHLFLGYCFFQKSMFEEAIEEFEKSIELSGRAPFQMMVLAIMYYGIGKKVEAEKLFEILKKRSRDEYVPPLCFFYIQQARGETDKAFEWLERACKEHDSFLSWMRVFPIDLLHIPDEPKYQDLLKKYGLR
jgi:serine/threonine-protein kinase